MIIHVSKLRCMQWITRMDDHSCSNFVHFMRRRPVVHAHTRLHHFAHLQLLLYSIITLSALQTQTLKHMTYGGKKSVKIQCRGEIFWDVAELLSCSQVIERINKAEPVCARLSRHQNAQHKHSLYTHAAQSESVLCQEKWRATEKGKKRKSKSDHASGGDRWEFSKDEVAVARWGYHFYLQILEHLNKKIFPELQD